MTSFQFNDKLQNENSVAIISLNFAKNIIVAFGLTETPKTSTDNKLISWYFPLAGCIKINMDGSSCPEDHKGGFGGLVRKDQGKWVKGFYSYIGYVEALKAEL